MKCSLLTLSTFIDDALPPDRSAEVDAHMVGCPRCTAGAATLREEKGRIRQLARVRVQPASAQSLLEQVGITGALVAQPPPRALPDSGLAPPNRPWLAGTSSASLPWTPRRPSRPVPPLMESSALVEEPQVPTAPADVQPDLPFDNAPAVAERNASPAVEALSDHPSPRVTPLPTWADLDDEPVAPLEPWEAAIPPYSGAVPEPDWGPSATPPVSRDAIAGPSPATPAPALMDTPSASPVAGGPPQRLEAPSGPRALWDRARDLVAVRLALARGDSGGADPADIVTAGSVRSLPPPIRGFEAPETAVVDVPQLPPLHRDTTEAQSGAAGEGSADDHAMELTGVTGAAHPTAPHVAATRAVREQPEAARQTPLADDGEDVGWNAFGAAAFRGNGGTSPEAPTAATNLPRPIGRHTRAVQRETAGAGTRVRAALLAVAAAGRTGGARAATSVRAGGAALTSALRTRSRGRPSVSIDRRAVGAVGAVVLIFAVALIIGHATAHNSPATAGPPRPSTAASAAPHTANPGPSASAPGAITAPLTNVQTFGNGGTGFQVIRLRYGVYNGYRRVVFDVGTATSAASGTPTATIGFSDPMTMVVSFSGTVPAGSFAQAPTGGVIASVTRVPASSGTTVYRFALSRPASAVAFYLTSPLRFVLDIH